MKNYFGKFILSIALAILMLITTIACMSLKHGSEYNRVKGAEKKLGHAIIYYKGIGKSVVRILHEGNEVDKFRLKAGYFSIVPLRHIGDNYSVRINFEYKVWSTTYKGKHTFENIKSELNVVQGLLIKTEHKILGRSRYSSDQQTFTGKVAQDLLNPRYDVIDWDDLVFRNKNQSDDEEPIDDEGKSEQSNTIEKQLEEIQKLYNDGIITEEEYQKARKGILNNL